jgi:LexA-binding, inner membrane-associated putative hydrolase
MLVGHFAVGLVAKRVEPQLSLGTTVLAAMLADFLWCLFMMAGVEQVQLRPGIGAANYWHPTNIALSHSLLMDAIWGALFAGAFVFVRRRPRGAWFLFAAVLSHWLLDFVSHRPDMPLLPGVPRYFGLGLWTSVPLTLVVEGGIWLLALVFYARATRPARRTGTYAFWSVVVLLTLAWYNNIAGPPPPNPQTAPIASLVFFSLVVAWGYWMNRLRPSAP